MIEYVETIKQKTSINPQTILEVGSRDGNDAEKLRKNFNVLPENVWIVEPNPTQLDAIKKRYPKFNLITNPIYNEEKNVTFYAVDTRNQIFNGISSLINRKDKLYDKVKTNKITLKTMLGIKLLENINKEIDVCKIDVEGATYEVLDSFKEKIEKIKSFHIESEHREVWENQKLYQDIHDFLIEKKYTQVFFKYCGADKKQSDSIWVKNDFVK